MTLMQAKGLIGSSPGLTATRRGKAPVAPTWLVADLVDQTSGKPYNTLWRYSTKKALLGETAKGKSVGAVSGFETKNQDAPYWGESFRWMDISVPFEKAALRVRLFYTDKNDDDNTLGRVVIPLEKLEEGLKSKGLPAVGESVEMAESGQTGTEGWFELKDDHASGHATPTKNIKDFAQTSSSSLSGPSLQLRISVKRPDQKPKKGTNHLRQLNRSQDSMGSKLDLAAPGVTKGRKSPHGR